MPRKLFGIAILRPFPSTHEYTVLNEADRLRQAEVFIIGCGYVGRRLARAEQARGRTCAALTHFESSAAELEALGITPAPGDLDVPDSLAALNLEGKTVYFLASPSADGETDRRSGHFCDAIDSGCVPERMVVISTTGVYGDCGGEWVDERHVPRPRAGRSVRRYDMETTLRAWAGTVGCEVVTLRVPGIYGPGRLPRARIQQGTPVLAEHESPWSNRIHVDDLVRVCMAAADKDGPSPIYNVADGRPGTMTGYFNQVADALGLPRPPQISRAEAEATLSPGMLSYLAESKRIDIRRMREELSVEPQYDLVVGLRACVEEERKSTTDEHC